ncbi:hypothetical protein H6P81_017729 [Aristolochia fimbriata]|uniref:Amidase domain-containing protein n=1 Tax=Aristolochia fimbriata TaxID=158543 RepID=A0AAV7DZ40_ARIFI|nr:hypothetical protein H6P81_017729 [Aristolochia fimbriata]
MDNLVMKFMMLSLLLFVHHGTASTIKEATIEGIHKAFKANELTSRRLVEFYLNRTRVLNPQLHAVLELNPDALSQADEADKKRLDHHGGSSSGLQGIPVLLKDTIATTGRMNTTAGSLALVGSVVPRDAGVVAKLKVAGAIILGKASLSEWSYFRSSEAPNGWCGRGGQGKNPYVLSADPCGSSSGSAIAVAANMVMVSLGTETEGSIICPSSANSVVGIKPTLGLTSRSGVIPLSPRQDTIGTVTDAVHVLEAIVGLDLRDEATRKASKFIPVGGYRQFLKADGLKGKKLGILKNFFDFSEEPVLNETFVRHFATFRREGATLVENLVLANESTIMDFEASGQETAILAEFKLYLNQYLLELHQSPVRSLADIIAFNNNHPVEEKIKEWPQDIFANVERTNGIGEAERLALRKMERLSRNGIERLMEEKSLDAILTPASGCGTILAIGGYPGISVPAGYDQDGIPIGLCFGGLKGSEPKLIEMAYSFEQATKVRKPPAFKP